ncbi:hypothetical protein D3C80_677100 [compost metagenome]
MRNYKFKSKEEGPNGLHLKYYIEKADGSELAQDLNNLIINIEQSNESRNNPKGRTDRKAKEIDHEYTHEIICPHCGIEHGDSWEINEDYGDMECMDCGEAFYFSRNVEVTYSTKK